MNFGEGSLGFVQLKHDRVDVALFVTFHFHKPMLFTNSQVHSLLKVLVRHFGFPYQQVRLELLFQILFSLFHQCR